MFMLLANKVEKVIFAVLIVLVSTVEANDVVVAWMEEPIIVDMLLIVVSVAVEPDIVEVIIVDVVNVERNKVLPIIDENDKLET